MATTSQLSENSHQGFEGLKAALCLASTEVNSNVASGMPVCLWQEGIRSRSSGKERDAETGLDYFLARYYSGAQGRFMTPDWSETPTPVPYADFSDPQTLNLYSYVRNNPMAITDPDGHGFLDWLKKTACSLGMESACVKEMKKEDPKEDRQELIEAQDDARSNPAFQREPSGQTHCNEATCAIATAVGAPTKPLADKNGIPVRANEQAANLGKHVEYREVSPQEAQRIANSGGLVIAAYENPNPKKSGHTATVRPEGVPGDQPFGRSGPLINDIGRYSRIAHQSGAFSKDKVVKYYTPK